MNCKHACALNDYMSMYQTMPQAWYMFNEHTGYALVQQSPVLIETELCMFTRGVIMGMLTDGCSGIWQPCEYCRVLSNDVVYMHDVIWQESGGWQGCWGAVAGCMCMPNTVILCINLMGMHIQANLMSPACRVWSITSSWIGVGGRKRRNGVGGRGQTKALLTTWLKSIY
jgi:hypothetical protein